VLVFDGGDGHLIRVIPVQVPADLGWDCAGNLYIVEETTRRVDKFAPDGTAAGQYGPIPGVFAFGLAIRDNGNLLVTSWLGTGQGQVTEIAGDSGVVVQTWQLPGTAIGIEFGPDGRAYVAVTDGASPGLYTIAGSGTPALFAGQATAPHLATNEFIAFSGSDVFVTTYDHSRVVQVDETGAEVNMFLTALPYAMGITSRPSTGDTDRCTPPAPDTMPPVLTLPAHITAEAASAAGAVVTFAATATDVIEGPRPVICTPPSGSTFPLGATGVNCSASDTSGNTVTGSFTVTVRDTTPPALSLPGNITAEATGPSGATVTYGASATDGGWDGAASSSILPSMMSPGRSR
jgi:hypothetical protein